MTNYRTGLNQCIAWAGHRNRGNTMENVEIEHYLHAKGMEPKIGKGASHETLHEVLIRFGMIEDGAGDIFAFVGECNEALREPDDVEDGVDKHEPVDISLTLEVLEVHRHHHVHCHKCRHIAVEVNFGGKTVAWPAGKWIKPDGSYATAVGNSGVIWQTSGTDRVLVMIDNGSIYYKVMR